MKTTIRRDINLERYNKLLLKEAKVWDIIKQLIRKAWNSDQKYATGFWIELIVIVILVVRK